jgi:hypothetical protein
VSIHRALGKETQPADAYHSQMQLHCLAKLNSVQLTGSRTRNDKVTKAPTAAKTVGMRQSTTAKHTQDEEKQSERDELAESPPEKTVG